MLNTNDYKTVITAKHKWLNLHFKETLKYKDLIFLFVKRDFVSTYKQTILGPLWALIQPLLTTIVFVVIFSNLAGLTTNDIAKDVKIPAFLFYMASNICWSYFSGTLSSTSNTFIRNSNIMGKVYYPRIVTPIASAFSNLISFGIQFVMFGIFLFYFCVFKDADIVFSFKLLFAPLCIIQLIILSVGLGTIISSVTTKYRDLAMLVGFILELWRYFSPIAYGLELVIQKVPQFMTLYMLNPITPIITTFRYAVFGTGYFNISYYLISWFISVVIFFVGLLLFNKIERTFMDTI